MNLKKSLLHLYASPKAVITQFLNLPGNNRIENVIERIEKLNDQQADGLMKKVMHDFASRHRDIEETFKDHFNKIEKLYGKNLQHFSHTKKLLTGAFFTKEYSIEAAALFNPSIVLHPDQTNVKQGEKRFVMSLRATGEGHISSIVFKTGVVDNAGNINLDKSSGYCTALQRNTEAIYEKQFIVERITDPSFNKNILSLLPQTFTANQAHAIFNEHANDASLKKNIAAVEDILDSNYELKNSAHLPLNEKVIFPSTKSECMGMEDVRFVEFNDANASCYYGTYTAYDGKNIKTQLIETKDFNDFKIRTLSGAAVSDKGMALFPEKINGEYVMISRQGGEKINIMFSENLYVWKNFQVLMEPEYEWELLQLGNCGSPVKTNKGWLLLTHGVGAMRTYVISAILLDLNDPSKIIGRLNKPLIEANEIEREGYVPNVVYTCGCMLHEELLVIPYAVSDAATAFATIKLDELLNEMKAYNKK